MPLPRKDVTKWPPGSSPSAGAGPSQQSSRRPQPRRVPEVKPLAAPARKLALLSLGWRAGRVLRAWPAASPQTPM